ncbi:thioredoxin-like 1-2, chloroplastic [Olea europaea subsp. europaea]|uniref:Thioredoxin-like 1-2, chloroplastic n=1 Tax=Olea europaea subsp. europaea TaxID=158383 RepID=A0A8S0RWI6_OLEEU|nr:thioredoxin-like 1-2, chloroplastic [Olea europaea subsp. europaea]
MSCSLKAGFPVSVSDETIIKNRPIGYFGVCPSIVNLQFAHSKSREFMGKPIQFSDQKFFSNRNAKASRHIPTHAQASICISRGLRWWEKTLMPNMIEIHSAQELVGSLLNAGDRLVIIDFYSPGCGGCKALHPKICQLAESNPDAIFLKVNYEELKTMCHSLHIHVLPFFRFYRGAEGKLCSFSCTNATVSNYIHILFNFLRFVFWNHFLRFNFCMQIKKFKDALAKYGTERCCLGPAKGLEDSELMALASTGQISRKLQPNFTKGDNEKEESVLKEIILSSKETKMGFKEGNAVLMA